jgi:hypothetical protein
VLAGSLDVLAGWLDVLAGSISWLARSSPDANGRPRQGSKEAGGHNQAGAGVNQVSAAAKRGTISTSPAAWRALLDR